MFYDRQVFPVPCNQSLGLVLPSSPHLEMNSEGAVLFPWVSLVVRAACSRLLSEPEGKGLANSVGTLNPQDYGFLQGSGECINWKTLNKVTRAFSPPQRNLYPKEYEMYCT